MRKILIFSDHPNTPSGLARITRDLATRIALNLSGEFNVATLGFGHRNPALPFTQFQWKPNEYFLPFELPEIARDWAGGEPLILLTINDIQRMLPVADPAFCSDDNLAQWIQVQRAKGKLELWGYFPVDAHNKDGKLSPQLAHTLTHYDRIVVPSKWAKGIIEKTIPGVKVDAIPHGINTDVFKPAPAQESREKIGEALFPVMQWPKQAMSVDDDALWIGIVATNQWRKDWGLGIEVVAELARTRPVFLWAHTDALKRDYGWSILELLSDFNLLGSSMVTAGNVSDQAMALAYSAMDVTLGIGRGEGFGYPIAESPACGVPCVAGTYGAHAEYMPGSCLVNPRQLRIEGPLNLVRPMFAAEDWISPILDSVGSTVSINPELDWNNLWPTWDEWFKRDVTKAARTLEEVQSLNYDHHRRMTLDHEQGGESKASEIKNKDDDSYRALLSNVPKVEKILELGSAWGGQWNTLGEWSEDLTGVDLYEPAVTKSQAEGKNIHLGFVEKLPFPDASFDLVCSRHVMEHVSDIGVAMAEIKRVLKPGGYAAAATPHRFPDLEPAHIQQLRIGEWIQEYAKSGFTVVSSDLREFECAEAHVVARKPE